MITTPYNFLNAMSEDSPFNMLYDKNARLDQMVSGTFKSKMKEDIRTTLKKDNNSELIFSKDDDEHVKFKQYISLQW